MKRIFAVLLTAVMLIAAFGPATAFAEAYIYLNNNGWHYYFYFDGHIELDYYNGSARDLTVPDKIGAVPVCGFYRSSGEDRSPVIESNSVRSVTFQLRVTELPPFFASNCSNLERATLPDELVTIGEYAFRNCAALSAINLPDSLQSIGPLAFSDCRALTSVTLPASLRTLGNNAFEACDQLQTVDIKEGVQSIGAYAFRDCTSLGSIELPDSVVSLGNGVFSRCTGLTKAELPNGLQGIAPNLFYGCSSLATCDIPSSVRLIYEGAFYQCKALTSVTLPAGLTTLEDHAFAESGLTSVFIPGGVTNIGASAFQDCKALRTVTMGYGVRTIGESIYTSAKNGYTFYGCDENLTVTLPASVVTVYANTFPDSPAVKKYFNGEKRLFDRVEFGSAWDKSGFKFRVPVSFVTEYGETPAAVSPYVGETVTLPVLTAKGYTFLGWKLGAKTYTDTYTAGTEGVTLTAEWEANENVVTFSTAKGETPTAQTVTSGNKATMPAGQTAGDEYLADWYTTPDCSGEPYDFSEPVLESFTLYAKWTSAPLIDVNLTGAGEGNAVVFRDKNNGSVVYASFTGSGSARVPADAVMEITAGSGMEYSGAIVSEIPLGGGMFEQRTVNIVNGRSRYTPNYGSAATVNVAFTAAPRVVANVVGDDDLNTDGLWALTDGYDPPHTLTNGSPVTLPDETGIGDVRNDLTLTLTVPEGYGCDGTIFNGGDEIPVCEGKTVYGFAPQGVVTLNLHFYKKADYVTLTFSAGQNDGRFFTLKYPRAATETVDVPDCPYAMEHGAFQYWSADVGGTAQKFYRGCDMSLPPEDTVFTAVWEDVRFIFFNKNGGEGSMEKKAASDLSASQGIYTTLCPACGFTRSGHVFTGWNTKKNGTGDAYFPIDLIDIQENITLYAQWAQAWTVRLHPNYDGGDDYVPQEIERGKGAALNAPFTREGYVLSGWNTAADGSGTFYAPGETITPTRDISLYAQWHEHDYRFDSFVWAADNKTAQAKLVCAGDETHVVYEAAEMTAYARGADCENDACTVYEAFYGDNCDTRTVTEEGSALGHDYGQPEWKWTSEEVEADAGDGETMIRAEMEVICSRCGEAFTMEADVEGETTAQPTETEPGQITYTAIAFIDDTEYTAEKTEAIPALGLPADEATEALIAAIGEVTYTPDCRAAIEMARALYDSLTAEERERVDNYATLTAAEDAYAALELLEQQRRVDMALSWTEKAYNGNPQKPAVTVTDYLGETLTENTDYTLTWSDANSKYPGPYTVTVAGIGQYGGKTTADYAITKQPLDASRVTLDWTEAAYNGTVQKPAVTVKNTAGYTMTADRSYTVKYSSDSKFPGSYTVTVTGKGYYTGKVTKSYTLTKQPLEKARVTLSWTTAVYNSTLVQLPEVTVTDGSGKWVLTEGKHYTVDYYSVNSKYPGTYTVAVNGKGNFTGIVKKFYTITKQPLDASRVTLEWTEAPCTGAVQQPAVTVTNTGGYTMTLNKSYTVIYSADGTTPGSYTVTVKGSGYYSGKVTKTFTVN